MLSFFPGPQIELRSADQAEGLRIAPVTVEFLNTQNPPQYAPHKMLVKLGAPIVILRNLRSVGVSNGQRGFILGVSPNRRIVTISVNGREVLLPRIDFYPPQKS